MKQQLRARLSYPDPFKPTGIEFELPEDAAVTLIIFDDKGEEVTTLMNQELYSEGKHTLLVNLSEYAKRNNVFRISAEGKHGQYVETRRIG